MEAQLLQIRPQEDGDGAGCGGSLRVERDKSSSTIQSNLELRLGMPDTAFGDAKAGAAGGLAYGGIMTCPASGSTSGLVVSHSSGGRGDGPCSTHSRQKGVWFPAAEAPPGAAAGFVHPWSLAARQEKAAFEQNCLKSSCCLPSSSSTLPRASQPPPVVGWPPVRANRRNVMSSRSSKPDIGEEEKEAKKSKSCEIRDTTMTKQEDLVNPALTMFVKVNMEGYAVGRKVDLMAHDGYDSLSRALKKMFENFLAVKQSNTYENDEKRHISYPELTLLYEDMEGDRMLVGDVPWEMFVGSVKRLFITYNIRSHVSIVKAKDDKKEKEDGDAMLHS